VSPAEPQNTLTVNYQPIYDDFNVFDECTVEESLYYVLTATDAFFWYFYVVAVVGVVSLAVMSAAFFFPQHLVLGTHAFAGLCLWGVFTASCALLSAWAFIWLFLAFNHLIYILLVREKLPELNTLLRDERQFATVLKKARGLMSSGDAETADEAKFVVEKIEAYGRRLLDEARSGKETDPARAADNVQRCAVLFKGSDLGTEAAKLNGEWKKDKQFQAAVKAGQQLAKLERMRDYIREQLAIDADATVTAEQAATIPAAMKSQIRSVAQGIGKSCPGSSLADKAAAIAAELAATP
jgi:hypothetical protein